jgi:TIR domain
MAKPARAGGIFINYRREETAPYAGRLADRLRDYFGEDRIFMDVDSITLGRDFVEAITSAVTSCEVLIALIGTEWTRVVDSSG